MTYKEALELANELRKSKPMSEHLSRVPELYRQGYHYVEIAKETRRTVKDVKRICEGLKNGNTPPIPN